jgi:hypothetical protein
MIRSLKSGSVVVTVLGVLGVMGAGCLTRPVTNAAPQTKTNFTTVVHNQTVDKVDLLFMIDNSASMGDKQALLALAVPDMINRLVTPNCLDANGKPTGTTAAADGTCPQGQKAEFPPVHDMHIGIVSSSLGGRGGDQCNPTNTNPAAPSLNAHNDDRGELINRGGQAGNPTVENPIADLGPSNYLGWFPNVPSNSTHTKPSGTPITTAATLVSDFGSMVAGVHEHGCGFEAQNEAWYRFLVQPDPFDQIQKNGTRATLTGIDQTILKQRADFLRPDSLLAVIVVTDENEEAADPLSIGGQGWAFDNQNFPGSPNGAAPEGTIECQNQNPQDPLHTGPNDPNCTSCAFINDPTRCPKDGVNGAGGYLDPLDDSLNTRFYHQKQRFGLFAGYPTSRYVRGLQKTTVPNTPNEHDNNGNYIGDQDSQANCVNPIYAQNLPTDPSADLCNLTRGGRDPSLVYYAAIAGVPHQLLQAKPGDPDCPSGTNAADCPQKAALNAADWTLIMGNDPEHYDFSGADFHMVENWDPRTTQGVMANASQCSPTSSDTCDPINGREWSTNKGDLQFSCVFDLTPQFPAGSPGAAAGGGKDCTQQMFSGACDCATGALNSQTQLCAKDASGTYTTTQIRGKAYPSVREMIIAKAMSSSQVGDQGIVSSLCPIHVTDQSGGNDPLFGYRPAVTAIIDRLKNSLSNQCLPQKLNPANPNDPTDTSVPCLILVQLTNSVGPGACKNPPTGQGSGGCDPTQGLLGPGVVSPNAPPGALPPLSSDVLAKFCDSQEATYLANKGQPGGPNDPDLFPVCALQQLTPSDPQAAQEFSNGSCAASPNPGWCYVTGAAAGGCPQAILFTNGEPPHGATVSLQCIESSVTVVDGGVSSSSGGGAGG